MSPILKGAGGAAGLACAVVAGLPFTRDYVRNGFHLWQFGRAMASTEHAPRTLCVSQEQRVGRLAGEQERLDFYVGQIRTYLGSRGDVERHYRSASVTNPVTNRAEPVELVFLDGDRIPESAAPAGLRTLSAWGVHGVQMGRPMYLVYVLRSYPANADPRCR